MGPTQPAAFSVVVNMSIEELMSFSIFASISSPRSGRGGFVFHGPNVGIGIIKFFHIGNPFLAFIILRDALDESKRIGGQSQPLGKNFHPKHVTLLCFKRDPILVARRVKLADIFARWRNALRLSGLIIWLSLG